MEDPQVTYTVGRKQWHILNYIGILYSGPAYMIILSLLLLLGGGLDLIFRKQLSMLTMILSHHDNPITRIIK